MLRPVVLVRPLELLEHVLDGGGHGLGVVEVVSQDHEDVGEVTGDVIGAGVDKCTETKHSCMSPQDSFGLNTLESGNILIFFLLLSDFLRYFLFKLF